MDQREQDISGFTPLYALSQALGIVVVVLTGIWLSKYRDGFSWSDTPKTQFNWHPLCMVLGMVYLYGSGILIYRAFRNEEKRKLKIIHGSVMLTSLILGCVGLKAVFDSHNYSLPPVPNLYSLHSWIGILVVIGFVMQGLFGFISFFYPGLGSHIRPKVLPYHTSFGLVLFVGAAIAALTGLTEKAIFSLQSEYSKKTFEGMLINWIGLFIILFSLLVVCLTRTDRFKRLQRPEDELLINNRMAD